LTPKLFLLESQQRGAIITLCEDRLHVDALPDFFTPAVTQYLQKNKAALVTLLQQATPPCVICQVRSAEYPLDWEQENKTLCALCWENGPYIVAGGKGEDRY
jgi:hypothetical protein